MKLTAHLKHLEIRQREVKRAVERASVRPLVRAGTLVEREAKRSMKKGGAKGRVGPRGGYVRVPSPPGTPPHVQTGALRASIQTAPEVRIGRPPVALVGPTEKYGAVHEFGGRHHPQRPFMRPALRRVQRRFPELFRNLRLGGP